MSIVFKGMKENVAPKIVNAKMESKLIYHSIAKASEKVVGREALYGGNKSALSP